MSNVLSNLMFGIIIFGAVITFWATASHDIAEVGYGRPTVEGLSQLSTNTADESTFSPFKSQVEKSEMVGTGNYQPYAVIPQMMSAMITLLNLPTVILTIFKVVATYIAIPSWFYGLMASLLLVGVPIFIAKVFLKEDF